MLGAGRGMRATTVVIAVVIAGLGVTAVAVAERAPQRLARRAMRLDPGARLGGNTQVVTAAGATQLGAPDRPNYMIALGRDERVVGGRGHDELQARGTGDRVSGGRGPDLIRGGHGAVLDGGRGNDLIVKTKGGATANGGPGHDRVISAAPKLGTADQQPVTGDGSNDNPFTAPCDDYTVTDCTVSSFPARTLNGWLSNEFVPAYECPKTGTIGPTGSQPHPYLLAQNFAPVGTTLPRGVEVQGLGPVGVSITAVDYNSAGALANQTETGFPNSSATNWAGGSQSYRVILHCTSDPNQGYGQ